MGLTFTLSYLQMNVKKWVLLWGSLCLCMCAVHAQPAPSDGWSGVWLNHLAFQKSTEDALRSRPSPYRADRVTDTGARLLNLVSLRHTQGRLTWLGTLSDSRTLGSGSAYSLTNPIGFGVNTVETSGPNRRAVDAKTGLQELAVSYRHEGLELLVGKIDTSTWYLGSPVFGGDLVHGSDFGNAATRVVAPPFPSFAVVLRQDMGGGLSLTGIAGDAFGDRETLHAARNLLRGDLAYVLELNLRDHTRHYQMTFNHVDAFRYLDKDAVWPVAGAKAPKVDAVMASASHRFHPRWAGFTRVSYARGAGQIEDLNLLLGVRYDAGPFYALLSQSATRVATSNTPGQRGARGDQTWVSEVTLNRQVLSGVNVGLTYNFYRSTGTSLLAKDGGRNGARHNHVVGVRMTSVLPW